MSQNRTFAAIAVALAIFLGLSALGYLLGDAAIRVKELERTVTVKGLAEREFPADVVIQPVPFTVAGNDLQALAAEIDANRDKIVEFLLEAGLGRDEISYSAPQIMDRSAQNYGGPKAEFRFVASQTVTIYSEDLDKARDVVARFGELGKQGVVLSGDGYNNRPDYIFRRLNEIKPEMVEEATRNAREVAQKFAADSDSKLGKIRRSSQGQFSISARDANNPHIKIVRVVSTIEYYLSD